MRSFLERVHELASSHDSDELSLPTAAPVAAVALYHLSTVHVHNIIRCFQLNYIIVSLYTSLTMLPANLQPAISCQQRCKFSPMCDMLHPIAAGIQEQGQGWRRGHSEEGEGGSERGTRPAEPGTDQSSSGGCLGGWGQVAEVPCQSQTYWCVFDVVPKCDDCPFSCWDLAPLHTSECVLTAFHSIHWVASPCSSSSFMPMFTSTLDVIATYAYSTNK